MKTLRFCFVLICILNINAARLFAQRNTKPNEETSNYLKQFRSDYIKSKLDKKPAILETYYGDNIRLMVEFQRTVFQKVNVLLYHTLFSTRFDTRSYVRNELEILDLGTMVVEDGSFTTIILSKTTGKEQELKGKYHWSWLKCTLFAIINGRNPTLVVISHDNCF